MKGKNKFYNKHVKSKPVSKGEPVSQGEEKAEKRPLWYSWVQRASISVIQFHTNVSNPCTFWSK